ncbi:MAG TPA: alpha-glucosidase, partial [Terriglobia bacterium]|nr:alpha-glucosidase [Terriglobia bacterium]
MSRNLEKGTSSILPLLAAIVVTVLSYASAAQGQEPRIVLERMGATVVLEPYTPNIIRVSMSLDKDQATAPPGYGFIAAPSAEGWTHRQDSA